MTDNEFSKQLIALTETLAIMRSQAGDIIKVVAELVKEAKGGTEKWDESTNDKVDRLCAEAKALAELNRSVVEKSDPTYPFQAFNMPRAEHKARWHGAGVAGV